VCVATRRHRTLQAPRPLANDPDGPDSRLPGPNCVNERDGADAVTRTSGAGGAPPARDSSSITGARSGFGGGHSREERRACVSCPQHVPGRGRLRPQGHRPHPQARKRVAQSSRRLHDRPRAGAHGTGWDVRSTRQLRNTGRRRLGRQASDAVHHLEGGRELWYGHFQGSHLRQPGSACRRAARASATRRGRGRR